MAAPSPQSRAPPPPGPPPVRPMGGPYYGPGYGPMGYGYGYGRGIGGSGGMVFGIIFLLIGLAIIYFGITGVLSGNASKNWPTTPGTMIVSNFTSTYSCDNNNGCQTYYNLVLEYSYSVSGKSYMGNMLSLSSSSSTSYNYVYGIINQYPPGANVTVYYNPSNPSQAVLQTGTGSGTYILLVLGLIFAAVGAFVALSRRSNRPPYGMQQSPQTANNQMGGNGQSIQN